MRGRTLHPIILLTTLAIPLLVLLASVGPSATKANPIALTLTMVGLVAGNVLLWRYTAGQRFLRTGLLLLKALLFNGGWTLAGGLLITGSLMAAWQKELASIEERLRSEEQRIVKSGNPGAIAQTKVPLYREALGAMQSFEAQLQYTLTETELAKHTRPLMDLTQRTRKTLSSVLERLQKGSPSQGAGPAPDMTAYQNLCEQRRILQARLFGPATGTPRPILPPLWRYILCAFGFIMAATGLVLGDETFVGPLLHIFPFFKSAARKEHEKAEKTFLEIERLLEEGKPHEALPLFAELKAELLSPAQQQEAGFYEAYTALHAQDADAALPILEKYHSLFPDFQPVTYLMGYAYLSAGQYDKAWPVWERLYQQSPDYSETKYHCSCAALAWAGQLMKEARVNEALPLFKFVRELGIHPEAVPEEMHNAQLMEAAGKLREGKSREAEDLFAQVEKEAHSSETAEGARFAALAQLGRALVDIYEKRGENAAGLLDELIGTFHTLTNAQKPPECPREQLQTPLAESGESPLDLALFAVADEGRVPGEEETKGMEEESATPLSHLSIRDAQLLRDLYFLRTVAQIIVWSATPSYPTTTEALPRDAVLAMLRRSLHFDPAFADALALYGFLIHFYGSNRSAAVSYLEQARHVGFEEQELVTLLQRLQLLLQLRAVTRTEMLDHLHQYFTSEEVPRRLKEELLKAEAIRKGYREYAGELSLEEIREHQPTLADLTARSRYLSEEIDRLVKALESSGDKQDQQRLQNIQEAMAQLEEKNKEIAEVQKGIEEHENAILRESGIFVLSDEF